MEALEAGEPGLESGVLSVETAFEDDVDLARAQTGHEVGTGVPLAGLGCDLPPGRGERQG